MLVLAVGGQHRQEIEHFSERERERGGGGGGGGGVESVCRGSYQGNLGPPASIIFSKLGV